METPKHGDERNRRQETTYGKDVEMRNATTGAVVYAGPITSSTKTVFEKYCAGCQQWIEIKGVFGMIEFWIAVHEGHWKETR